MTVRTNLIHWTLVALPFFAAAQSKQFVSSARSGDSVRQNQSTAESPVVAQPAATVGSDNTAVSEGSVNTIPLFGERSKTAAQISEEIHFLNDCDRNFASRAEASNFFADRGWDYVKAGQLDTATHRFNLSWLLNNRNPEAYWGLGVVCYQKNQLPEAIRMLKKGVVYADSNTVLMTDLATLEIKHFQEKPDSGVLADAENNLQRAITISPADATSIQKMSVIYYLKADYAKAWDYFHQTWALDNSALDLNYLHQLLAKQPDPKGIFK